MKQPDEREAVLLWLPSALPSLAPEALSYAFVSLALTGLRWDTLGAAQFRVLEALFVHYHTGKGNLRYAAAGDAKEGGGWFSKLWKVGRKADKGERGDEELIVEAMPSSLTGMRELWLAMTVAPEESRRLALPLLVKLHLRPAAALDLSIVRHELLRAPSTRSSASPRRRGGPRTRRAARRRRRRARSRRRACCSSSSTRSSRRAASTASCCPTASWRGQSCKLAVTVEIAGEEEGASPTATAAPTAAAEAPTAAAAEAPRSAATGGARARATSPRRRRRCAPPPAAAPARRRRRATSRARRCSAARPRQPDARAAAAAAEARAGGGGGRGGEGDVPHDGDPVARRGARGRDADAARAPRRRRARLRLDPRKEHVGKGEGRETRRSAATRCRRC